MTNKRNLVALLFLALSVLAFAAMALGQPSFTLLPEALTSPAPEPLSRAQLRQAAESLERVFCHGVKDKPESECKITFRNKMCGRVTYVFKVGSERVRISVPER